MTISAPSATTRLRLGSPPREYDESYSTYIPRVREWLRYEISRNMDLEQADKSNFKHFEDLDLANRERLILVAPDGGRWSLTVDNSGNLGTAAA